MNHRESILGNVNRTFVEKESASIGIDDVCDISNRGKEIKTKVNKSNMLKRYLDDIFTLISLLTDYVKGNYRNIPFKIIAAITFALVYILNPIDLIPDVIPGVGMIDDVAVLTICLNLIKKDLLAYKQWKEKEKDKRVIN